MEKVRIGRVLWACIKAATVEESIPPERNAPTGTSASIRRATESRRRVSSCFDGFVVGAGEGFAQAALGRFGHAPPGDRLRGLAAFSIETESHGSCRQLGDATIDGLRGGHVAVVQVGREGRPIDLGMRTADGP